MKKRLSFVCLAILFTTGCASGEFNRENFDRVDRRSDRSEVRSLLGPPRSDQGDQWYYENEQRGDAALVFFDSKNRVRDKHWIAKLRGGLTDDDRLLEPTSDGRIIERGDPTVEPAESR